MNRECGYKSTVLSMVCAKEGCYTHVRRYFEKHIFWPLINFPFVKKQKQINFVIVGTLFVCTLISQQRYKMLPSKFDF